MFIEVRRMIIITWYCPHIHNYCNELQNNLIFYPALYCFETSFNFACLIVHSVVLLTIATIISLLYTFAL